MKAHERRWWVETRDRWIEARKTHFNQHDSDRLKKKKKIINCDIYNIRASAQLLTH